MVLSAIAEIKYDYLLKFRKFAAQLVMSNKSVEILLVVGMKIKVKHIQRFLSIFQINALSLQGS